jgi:hypothetical protein
MSRRVVRIAVIVLVTVVGLAGSAAVWGALRVLPVRTELFHAAGLLVELEDQLGAGDFVAARDTLDDLAQQARAIRATTDGYDWRLAARGPGPATNLAAIRVVASVLDELSTDALPAIVEVATALDLEQLMPRQERLELAPLETAAPALNHAKTSIRRLVNRLADVDTARLRPEVGAGIEQLRTGLARVGSLVGTAATASSVLPSMLGRHGDRTILVLFQNPAELRATGGIPGAFLVIRAEDGTLRPVDQATAAAAIRSFPTPVLPLTDEQVALYTDRLGRYPADVNLTPHFPTAATLAAEMYRQRTGTTVDAVVATDPVALSYLLTAIGPIEVPSGPPLTADNAVQVLLSDIHATMDTRAQDRYIIDVALSVFDRLAGGVPEPRTALSALARAAGEHRLLVWSAHPDEQEVLEDTVLAGALADDDPAAPTIGVYFNDGSGAKLGYYISGTAHLYPGECHLDGRRILTLRLTLTSTAPTQGLPDSVLGLGLAGDPYTARTNVLVASPTRGGIVEMILDGTPTPFGQGVERRRVVGVLTVDLAPGQTRELVAHILTQSYTGEILDLSPDLRITPGVNPWAITVEPAQNCPIPD